MQRTRLAATRSRVLAVLLAVVALVAVLVAGVTLSRSSVSGSPTAVGASKPTPSSPPASAPGTAPTFRPGAVGIGDPYFPDLGNGGFDVAHYDLALAYAPAARQLSGTVTVTATATQDLSAFDLDLSGMTVSAVTVDGRAARFRLADPELQITPSEGIRRGASFTAAVTYSGSPKTITNTGIVFGGPYGWEYTRDGVFVGDEPDAAHTWFPCSDHPSDKASYRFHITVPNDQQVVANGELRGKQAGSSTTTWTWDETRPMATYLASIGLGRWTFRSGRTPGGTPETMAYDPNLAAAVARADVFGKTAAITDYWAQQFGAYPFTSTGAIVDNVPGVGFSLEVQTRPLYGFAADQITMAHELAHQWFGDDVSVQEWRDIWLNEGFATYAEWLWEEHVTGTSAVEFARRDFAALPAGQRVWEVPVADPGAADLFSAAVYDRGGMTLAALRALIGDSAMTTLLRRWVAAHRYGNATTAQFEALAQQISGKDLRRFFTIWLVDKGKPTSFDAH